MKAFFGWLLNRALLYLLLVLAIGFALIVWPSLADLSRGLRAETASRQEIVAAVEQFRDDAQGQLASVAADARTMPPAQLEQRIAQRRTDRALAQAALEESRRGWFGAFLPSRVLARKRAEIELALIDQELALLETALAPRRAFADAQAFFVANPTRPTLQAIATAQERCRIATTAQAEFRQRWEFDQRVREAFRSEQTRLAQAQATQCNRAQALAQRRADHLAAETRGREAYRQLSTLAAQPLPESFADDISGITLRDILLKALVALVFIIVAPFVIRLVCWFTLAPLAQKWPPMRFAESSDALALPPAAGSRVSLPITLAEGHEVLVRQDFLQSSSMAGEKRTQWLLDWRHPITSLASGMRFLTRIRGTGEQVVVSAQKDVLSEIALLELPAGAAAVVRPSALAAIVQREAVPVRITSHWRLLSLPAWLTLQLRYFVFHGPAGLVLRGGRGVRIEPAARGRIVSTRQVIGFSSGLAYSVIRSETFWPYFFGRESLLKDRIEAGRGVLLIEESPLAGRSGLRRGFEGALDALLKVGGV